MTNYLLVGAVLPRPSEVDFDAPNQRRYIQYLDPTNIAGTTGAAGAGAPGTGKTGLPTLDSIAQGQKKALSLGTSPADVVRKVINRTKIKSPTTGITTSQ